MAVCLVLLVMLVPVTGTFAQAEGRGGLDERQTSLADKRSAGRAASVIEGGTLSVGGHQLQNFRDLIAHGSAGSSAFPVLHEERRWAIDEEERLKALIDELQATVHPVAQPVEMIALEEYNDRIRKINVEIDINEKKQLAGPSESDKVNAHMALITLTRQKGALGAAREETRVYETQKQAQDRTESLLKGARDDYLVVNDYLLSLDDVVNSMLLTTDANNHFKLWICIAFSVLIGFVILGFFSVAWREKGIREVLFSDDSGLQFVALFSIIIAIILFGITNILEGRELAALLGGLSGYILGRGNRGQRNRPGGELAAKDGQGAQTAAVAPAE